MSHYTDCHGHDHAADAIEEYWERAILELSAEDGELPTDQATEVRALEIAKREAQRP